MLSAAKHPWPKAGKSAYPRIAPTKQGSYLLGLIGFPQKPSKIKTLKGCCFDRFFVISNAILSILLCHLFALSS